MLGLTDQAAPRTLTASYLFAYFELTIRRGEGVCVEFRAGFVWFPWSRSAQIAEWFRSEGLFIYANCKREVEIAWNTKRQKKSISDKFRRGHRTLWASGKAWSQCFVSLVHVQNVRKSNWINRKEPLCHEGSPLGRRSPAMSQFTQLNHNFEWYFLGSVVAVYRVLLSQNDREASHCGSSILELWRK